MDFCLCVFIFNTDLMAQCKTLGVYHVLLPPATDSHFLLLFFFFLILIISLAGWYITHLRGEEIGEVNVLDQGCTRKWWS